MIGRNLVVLVKERHIARLIQVNLERQGFIVNLATSQSHALELIASEKPDAILAQLSMRFLKGVDVFRTLKQHPSTGNIPIYIVPIPFTFTLNSFRYSWTSGLEEYQDYEKETIQ